MSPIINNKADCTNPKKYTIAYINIQLEKLHQVVYNFYLRISLYIIDYYIFLNSGLLYPGIKSIISL